MPPQPATRVQFGTFDIEVNGACVAKFGDGTPHRSFGELALLYNSPRAATVRATSSGSLWCVVTRTPLLRKPAPRTSCPPSHPSLTSQFPMCVRRCCACRAGVAVTDGPVLLAHALFGAGGGGGACVARCIDRTNFRQVVAQSAYAQQKHMKSALKRGLLAQLDDRQVPCLACVGCCSRDPVRGT